jgi:hypothetical protein
LTAEPGRKHSIEHLREIAAGEGIWGKQDKTLKVEICVLFLKNLLLEEKWMAEEFGDDYRAYRRRVRALVPFLV